MGKSKNKRKRGKLKGKRKMNKRPPHLHPVGNSPQQVTAEQMLQHQQALVANTKMQIEGEKTQYGQIRRSVALQIAIAHISANPEISVEEALKKGFDASLEIAAKEQDLSQEYAEKWATYYTPSPQFVEQLQKAEAEVEKLQEELNPAKDIPQPEDSPEVA